jgi:hypothetical protein
VCELVTFANMMADRDGRSDAQARDTTHVDPPHHRSANQDE